jgi:small subunit ribosomal protein S2
MELQIKDLLEAGAHFGHQTNKWNPKMKPYIYKEKNGIYIIDLSKTVVLAKKAYDFLKEVAATKPVLFVGTKGQCSEYVREAAIKCRAFYITHRWPGGMLTNFKTIMMSVEKMNKVEKIKESGEFTLLTKKERAKIEKGISKMDRSLGGIRYMRKLPGALLVVDPASENIAVKEAQKLKIPVVAITDTNCDPEGIDYVVPGNDDAIKSVKLFIDYFAEAIFSETSKNRDTDPKGEDRDVLLEQEILSKFEKDIDLKEEGVDL